MADKVKFSAKGLPREAAVDVDALSDRAKRFTRVVAMGDFTQSTTVKHNRGPLGEPGLLVAAYASAKTAPVGGTLTFQVVAYDASGNAEVALTDAANPEAAALTVREGMALTIATTNVELAAEDTIEIHTVADGSAVSQQQVDGTVTLVFEKVEASTPTRD